MWDTTPTIRSTDVKHLRPLYTLRFPREGGVRQCFSSQLTMLLGVFACNLVGDALAPTLRGLEGRAPLGLSPPGLRH
jgi:hypothetical protein